MNIEIKPTTDFIWSNSEEKADVSFHILQEEGQSIRWYEDIAKPECLNLSWAPSMMEHN